MGLLAVLKLKPIDVPEPVTGDRAVRRRQGRQGQEPLPPKVAQVAVEPEIEKTDGKSGDGSPGSDTAPEKTGGKDGESEPEKAKLSPAEVKAKSDYKKARDAIKKLIDDLNANAQRGAIMAQINQATAKLAEADAHAAKLEFPQANAALAATGVICAAARKLADDWGAYAKLRASCAAMVSAFKGFDTAAVTAIAQHHHRPGRRAGRDHAAQLRRRHRQAADASTTSIRPKLKVRVDGNKAKLVALEALDPKVKTFLAERAHQGALARGHARVVVRQRRVERPAQRLGGGLRRAGADGADGAAAPGLRDPAHGDRRRDRRGQGRRRRSRARRRRSTRCSPRPTRSPATTR